ncbi:hypothetical protein G6F59_018117 [Rhizopus arrhizus]|nr:hypothetical protein G6F59_018117 [Rhizopus arrhizus]
MSKASVDLPEPDTPVITVNLSCGISTLMFFRLCSRALRISIAMLPWRRARITDCSGVPSPAPLAWPYVAAGSAMRAVRPACSTSCASASLVTTTSAGRLLTS